MSHTAHNHTMHNHTPLSVKNINNAFYLGIVLNVIFTGVEFGVGYFSHSLALIADASHNLSDVVSLLISLIGMKLAQKAATHSFTYGYKKASILASLINAVLLIVIVVNIFIEAIKRLSVSPDIGGQAIMITALIGVVINSVSAFLFYKGQKQDINIKGAFLHLLVDAMVSVGVVISGIIIYFTQWNIVDSIISFVIAIVILISTWNLLKESVKLILDAVPENVDVQKIKKVILNNKHIQDVHHIHVWSLSSAENALTAHITLDKNSTLKEVMYIKNNIKKQIKQENIHHATIEVDNAIVPCEDKQCK